MKPSTFPSFPLFRTRLKILGVVDVDADDDGLVHIVMFIFAQDPVRSEMMRRDDEDR